jgi:hypothetical protein
VKQGKVQKFAYVFFFAYWKYLHFAKTNGPSSVRLIPSNDACKAARQVIQSNPEACFAFAREKVKVQEAISNNFSSSSSTGTTAHCGLWPVEQDPSIFFLSVTSSLHHR